MSIAARCQVSHRKVLPKAFDAAAFLQSSWQRTPCLIRADKAFVDLISPEELAGLACEPGVESRLVQVDTAQQAWEVTHGPFEEQDFLSMPTTHFSLMVQAVDQWYEPVSELLEEFSFIPGWRIDDVMISYSGDQGNVGPHYDQYDVFLIQGKGRKRWQIGDMCDSRTELRDHTDLKLLRDFNVRQEWILEPGDILYLPPGIAHYGVALGNSMTYSVGFRAPSMADLVEGIADEALMLLTEDNRYQDSAPAVPAHPGQISPQVFSDLSERLREVLSEPQLLRRSFGKVMTQRRYPLEVYADELPSLETLSRLRDLAAEAGLYKTPGSRFAYYRPEPAQLGLTEPKLTEIVELYVDGTDHVTTDTCLPLIEALCAPGYRNPIDPTLLNEALRHDEAAALLISLYNQSSVYFE